MTESWTLIAPFIVIFAVFLTVLLPRLVVRDQAGMPETVASNKDELSIVN